MSQSVLITGCSDGGMGAALALAFRDAGFRVIATARNPAKMSIMKEHQIEIVALDVQSEESIAKAAIEVSALLNGRLDILVNNAGAGYMMPVLDIDIAELRNLFDLNVFSLIPTTRHFFPLLCNSPHAIIANNTSVVSFLPIPLQGAYNASKAAAALLTQNMRLELKPFGIRVVDLKTGGVKTNFFANVTAGPTLPPTSPYLLARDLFEPKMGGAIITDGAIPAPVWARKVVADLTRKSPPHLIWHGSSAVAMWLATFFPLWFLDGPLCRLMSFDVFTKRLQAERGTVKQA